MSDQIKIEIGKRVDLAKEFRRLANLASIEHDLPLELCTGICASARGLLPQMMECKLEMDCAEGERAENAEKRMDVLTDAFTDQWRAIGEAFAKVSGISAQRVQSACKAIFMGMLHASMDELMRALDEHPESPITIRRAMPPSDTKH